MIIKRNIIYTPRSLSLFPPFRLRIVFWRIAYRNHVFEFCFSICIMRFCIFFFPTRFHATAMLLLSFNDSCFIFILIFILFNITYPHVHYWSVLNVKVEQFCYISSSIILVFSLLFLVNLILIFNIQITTCHILISA